MAKGSHSSAFGAADQRGNSVDGAGVLDATQKLRKKRSKKKNKANAGSSLSRVFSEPRKLTMGDLLSVPRNVHTARKLALTTVLMFTIPLIAYFALQTAVIGVVLDKHSRMIYSAVSAAVSVNVIIILFVVMAFLEK